ncbi:hypothetical protein ACEQ8H_002676 [Pleosporales sp. CAS-2024a]
MAKHLAAKKGAPAIAYLSSHDAVQWSCSLIIKHAEAFHEATISLHLPLASSSSEGSEAFRLIYNVDNLVPEETSLKVATMCLGSDQLHQLARAGNPQLMDLCLSLRQSCFISYSGDLPVMNSVEGPIRDLLDLATARKIHVLFDFKWIHQQNHALFRRIINQPQDYTGLPVDACVTLYRPEDWLPLALVNKPESQAPPSYSVASKKRSRHSRASSTPEPVPSKRALLENVPDNPLVLKSPTAECTSVSPATITHPEGLPPYDALHLASVPIAVTDDELSFAALEYPGSPTEKATTVATSSRRSSRSSHTGASNVHDIVYKTVQELLPQAVQAALPGALAKLLSVPPISPSSSMPSPRLNEIAESTLGRIINAQAAAYAKTQLQEFRAETYAEVERLRDTASDEFYTLLEEKKREVEIAKDDNLLEVDRVFAEKLDEFRDRAEEVATEVSDRAYVDLEKKSDKLVWGTQAFLAQWKALETGTERVVVKYRSDDERRRATSLPL